MPGAPNLPVAGGEELGVDVATFVRRVVGVGGEGAAAGGAWTLSSW